MQVHPTVMAGATWEQTAAATGGHPAATVSPGSACTAGPPKADRWPEGPAGADANPAA
jgi:hypothetical protein